jgi:hypothetical protein
LLAPVHDFTKLDIIFQTVGTSQFQTDAPMGTFCDFQMQKKVIFSVFQGGFFAGDELWKNEGVLTKFKVKCFDPKLFNNCSFTEEIESEMKQTAMESEKFESQGLSNYATTNLQHSFRSDSSRSQFHDNNNRPKYLRTYS